MSEVPMLPNLITISLAAQMLGMSRGGAHRLVKTKKLHAWRIPAVGNVPLVVLRQDVEALMRARAALVVSVEESVQ